MSLVFTTTDRQGADHGVKMLVYGAAGTGKTTFCGTAPSPLIISAEKGLLSLRNKSIPVIEVSVIDDVQKALDWCKTDAAKQGIKTICLDSISEIVEKCLANSKATVKDPRQAYGEMAEQSIKLIKEFRDLPGFNVVLTAKQAIVTDPVTGVAKAAPTAPGQQVGQQLPYLFDLVLHSYSDKDANGATYFALRTRAAFNAEAKDRSGVLDEIEYPDANNLINKIKASPTAQTAQA